jgi:DNA (cytosine-5)-methyltransferase 1
MARIIHEVRPKFVFVENSPMLTSRGLGTVLGDLAAMGFDARWGVLGAANVGANHQRDRIWIVAKWRGQLSHTQYNRIRWWEQQQESIKEENRKLAHSDSFSGWGGKESEQSERGLSRESISNGSFNSEISDSNLPQQQRGGISIRIQKRYSFACDSRWWEVEPNVGRVVDGVAARVDRLKAIGNGQVPLCAATAWMILSGQKNTGISVKSDMF